MSSETSFHYSLSSAPAGEEDALYAFAQCDLIPVDDERILAMNRLSGHQMTLAPRVVEALLACASFRPLAAHADTMLRAQPALQGNRAAALDVLRKLRDAGMLLDGRAVLKQLHSSERPTLAPTRVFVITCDRPEAVRRLLDSMAASGDLAGHDALFLIDDSREAANQAANREAVAAFNNGGEQAMGYVGPAEQGALLAHLLRELPAQAGGIRFLLDPAQWEGCATYGRARTLALLLSVGYRALVLDDDILCEAVLSPVRGGGLTLMQERQAAFFEDREALLAARRPASVGPLSGHAEQLGQPLGTALQQLNGGMLDNSALRGCDAAPLCALRADTPVLVTQCGSLGDTGIGGAHWALYVDQGSIQRLLQAPHGVERALENGNHWVGTAGPAVHKMPLMSQLTGLDHSHLLPPYFPAFRGEDLLFGTMIEAMYPHGAVLEYPWSVPHLPIDGPRARSLGAPFVQMGGMNLLSNFLLARIDYGETGDPQRALLRVAQLARGLAERPLEAWLADYRRAQAQEEAEKLQHLHNLAARSEQLPASPWQDYLKRALREVYAAIEKPRSPTAIPGLPDGLDDAALHARFRDLAMGWADALEAWPAMREACRDGLASP